MPQTLVLDVDIPDSTFATVNVSSHLMMLYKGLDLDVQATMAYACACPALSKTIKARHQELCIAIVNIPAHTLSAEKLHETFTLYRIELLILQDLLAFLDQAKMDLEATFPGMIQDKLENKGN